VFHKTRAVRNLGSSQSCCVAKSMNVFEKEKRSCPFCFEKASSFFSALKFYTFSRELAVIMIIQLSKNIWFMGDGVETNSTKTIHAQTALVAYTLSKVN